MRNSESADEIRLGRATEPGDLPIATPLAQAVAHGVFGYETTGPIEPDEEGVRSMTEEQAAELAALLSDSQAVEQAQSDGRDPRTGRLPRTEQARKQLEQFLAREAPRLKAAYADCLAAYAEAFGQPAAETLDRWVRKAVAGAAPLAGVAPHDTPRPLSDRYYGPGHPWHYLAEGDNAPPIPVDDIDGDPEAGKYLERDLPKNPEKREAKLRELLAAEGERLRLDKARYADIVRRGAEALSRYDREIAYGDNDALARGSSLALKFCHISHTRGRIAWIEQQLASDPQLKLFPS